ncbi:hypothetical protein VKT23_016717 [Stygiomarasmius scandens]|uniref:Uncharacterized protein n=1 Tax=Marasmiellus scandens TaxID=2682957 RepID=A0ABR1IKF0_9AGAR
MTSIFVQDGKIVSSSSITSIPSSIAVLDNMISMTCLEILSRAGLPCSDTSDLHPPPLPPSRFITCPDIRSIASLHIFEMVAPNLAERVFTFVNKIGPQHKHGGMKLNMHSEDHDGNVTLTCRCGLLLKLGSMNYLEGRNLDVCLWHWDREEKVLKEYLERVEVTARHAREFEEVINELATMKKESNEHCTIVQSK